jgi:hypothetical protein
MSEPRIPTHDCDWKPSDMFMVERAYVYISSSVVEEKIVCGEVEVEVCQRCGLLRIRPTEGGK